MVSDDIHNKIQAAKDKCFSRVEKRFTKQEIELIEHGIMMLADEIEKSLGNE